jgi:cysteine-rich repeat protein
MLRYSTRTALAMVGACAAWTSHASARPTNGGWYLLQGSPPAVIEFTAGGNLPSVPPLATGAPLAVATGLCYGGPDNDLYAATPAYNAVYKITAGGSFNSVPPFAYHFPGSTGAGNGDGAYALACSGSRVLVSVLATGTIYDVTHGGDMSDVNVVPFATGLPPGETADLLVDSTNKVWALSQTVGIYDITAGGDFSQTPPAFPYDLGGPWGMSQLTELGGHLYVLEIIDATWSTSVIYDFTALQPGDALSNATPFAWGPTVGLGLASSADRMMVSDACPGWDCPGGGNSAVIYDATAGGDVTVNGPFAGGWEAWFQWAEDLVYIHYCGDGIVWPNSNETCDPGVAGETAVCDSDCTAVACGDGMLNVTAGEHCDDGLLNSDIEPDACRESCELARCGDGVIDTGEDCDDGAHNSDTADHCRTSCTLPTCGDSIVDDGEECDEGAANSDSTPDACRTDCTEPTCGDAVADVSHDEECDTGAFNSDHGPDACRKNCMAASCGDGTKDTGEECDDGNHLNGDGCSVTCELDGTGGAGGGTGGSGAEGGAGGQGASGATGGAGGEGGEGVVILSGSGNGCSCRATGSSSGAAPGGGGLLALGLLGLGGLHRRRRG